MSLLGFGGDAVQPEWLMALTSLLNTSSDRVPEGEGEASDANHVAMLKLGLIVDGDGLKSDGSRGAPQASVSEHNAWWKALEHMVDNTSKLLPSEADGVAGAHSHEARMEAAEKLVGNHGAVLYDVSNPQPRTQHHLERVSDTQQPYADEALFECARRLLGRRPGTDDLAVHAQLDNVMQCSTWAAVYRYMAGRIHHTPGQKPDRPPDMSLEAGAAMKAVFEEIGLSSITESLARSSPQWLMLHTALEEGGSLKSEAWGMAAAHTHAARQEAAMKLISNHESVLKDIANPLHDANINGMKLTQLELLRVDTGCAMYTDQMLREIVRRLLGVRSGLQLLEVRMDPTNELQVQTWQAVAKYLDGRIQATPDQKPSRTPDMSPAAAAAMRAVLAEVAAKPWANPGWDGLKILLEQASAGSARAEGAAGSHKQAAREEAARKLIDNHERVLADVTNPSRSTNIDGKLLTQCQLKRVQPQHSKFADQAMREVTRRLLGCSTASKVLVETVDPTNQVQVRIWSQTAEFLIERIHSTAKEKPGRTPDMSPEAATAMRAVLTEVGSMALSTTIAATTPHWAMLHKALETGGSMPSEAGGVAGSHNHASREEAARRLITNHENVLKDVTNPSKYTNIDGKELTQLELQRVDPNCAVYADEALREVVRRLLGRRAGLQNLEVRMDPSNTAQAITWGGVASYLDGRIQAKPEQKPGRTPDMSPAAAAAMRAVLAEVGMTAVTNAMSVTSAEWSVIRGYLGKISSIERVSDQLSESFKTSIVDPLERYKVTLLLQNTTVREGSIRCLLRSRENILFDVAHGRSDALELHKQNQQKKQQDMRQPDSPGLYLPQNEVPYDELPRVGFAHVTIADEILRECARAILGIDGDNIDKLGPDSEAEGLAWVGTTIFINHAIIPTLPVPSEDVRKALTSVLYQLENQSWRIALRKSGQIVTPAVTPRKLRRGPEAPAYPVSPTPPSGMPQGNYMRPQRDRNGTNSPRFDSPKQSNSPRDGSHRESHETGSASPLVTTPQRLPGTSSRAWVQRDPEADPLTVPPTPGYPYSDPPASTRHRPPVRR